VCACVRVCVRVRVHVCESIIHNVSLGLIVFGHVHVSINGCGLIVFGHVHVSINGCGLIVFRCVAS